MKQALSNSIQIGFVRFVTTAMFVQGFWYGGHLVTTGRTSACDVLTTFWACLMATKPIEDILPHMLVLEKGRAAGAGTKATLDQMSGGLKDGAGERPQQSSLTTSRRSEKMISCLSLKRVKSSRMAIDMP